MEFGTPRHETGFQRSPEGDKSSDTSEKKTNKDKDKKDKDKQLAGSAALKAEIDTDKKAPEKASDNPAEKQPAETMWQRLIASDTDVFGIEKPKADTDPGQKTETSSELQSDTTDILDTTAEVRQGIRDFTESRRREVAEELQSIPESEHNSLPAVEAAADAALLRATSAGLKSKDSDPAEIIEAATRHVAEDIDRSVAVVPEHNPDATLERDDQQETADSIIDEAVAETSAEAADDPEAHAESIIHEDDAEDEHDDPAATQAANGSSSGGTTSSSPPSGPPPVAGSGFPGSPGGPGGPPSGQGGGGGNRGYYNAAPNMYAWNQPPASPNVSPTANVAPTPPAAVFVPVSSGREQAAAAKGLLAGGIVGYFWGRNRGRKQGAAKANRQNEPILKALEADKRALQQNLTVKEQQIRQQAHDKFEAAAQAGARSKYVEREVQAQQALRPAAIPLAAAAESVSAAPETITTQQAVSSERSAALRAAEVLAAPLVLAGEVPIRGAHAEQAPATELLVHERHLQERAQTPVVPFDKKAKDFSRQELMATAEKVSVQGTTLKEMVELGRLDEPALRRVTQEFLDGGDVGAAVNREVAAKESFERDPQLRQAADERDESVNGTQDTKTKYKNGNETGNGGLLAALAGAFGTTSANGKAASKDQAAPAGGRSGENTPTPDDATLKELRERQMAMVAGGTLLVAVVAVIVALILT